MQVTDTKVFLATTGSNNLKAYASVVIDDSIIIRDIRIVQAPTGKLIVAMPSKKVGNAYIDIAHPINTHARESLENAILTKYRSVLDEKVNIDKGIEVKSNSY